MSAPARMDRLLRRLRHDENGSVFVFVTLTIFVMMGMVGLALDGARYFSLNSELQDLADAAALAGAGELDRTIAGVTEAENQARTLLANSPHWGETGSTGAQVATVSFAGPDNPDQAIANPTAFKRLRLMHDISSSPPWTGASSRRCFAPSGRQRR